MNAFTRAIRSLIGKAEGQAHPGPWWTDQGWLPPAWGQYWNYWQMGYNPLPFPQVAMVEACVSSYAQTIAMCPYNHWRDRPDGGRDRITTSALYRIMRAPNDYQTRSDFMLNLVRSLYLDGNAYALALRNSRFEISSLHLMNPRFSRAQILNGEIYYSLGGNIVIDNRMSELGGDSTALHVVPARDVLHVKLQVSHEMSSANGRHDILHGQTPLQAAGLAIATSGALMGQAVSFFGNQSRPSGVLQSDLQLTAAQMAELRERWNEQAKGLAIGGTPILSHGLKFSPITMSAKDTQFVDAMKLSDEQIAEVFRIPLAIVGNVREPGPAIDILMNFWISNGLGFALNQVEMAVDKLFGLNTTPDEYSELDTSILLRSAFKDRIDALASGVQGGIYSPNEARAFESLPAVENGDEPRVQQQVVPLSFASEPPVPPAAPASAPGDAGGDAPPPAENAASVIDIRKYFREMRGAA